jgi:hypothetical protein
MLSDIAEGVKFFGGLSGLASAIFLIYDRLYRSQPIAFLMPHEYKAALRLKNVAKETIIIEGIDVSPPIIQVHRGNDLRTVNEERQAVWYPKLNDEKEMRVFIILTPESERTFHLHRSAEFEEADDETVITFRCKWRNTRKPLPVFRSVYVRVLAKDVRAFREASLAGKA